MEYDEHFTEKFSEVAQGIFEANPPERNTNLKPGTISSMQAYIEDFGKKIEEINKQLTEGAIKLLQEAKAEGVDVDQLQLAFREIANSEKNKYISKHKPQSRS